MKLVLEGQLLSDGEIYKAMPGERLLIDENQQVYIGESLNVMSGPHSEYLASGVYTVELQNVPMTCPFIKYAPLRMSQGATQRVLQYTSIHIKST